MFLSSVNMGGLLAGFAGAMFEIMIISIAISILMIVANWKLFTKAGEEGWKCLIPIYIYSSIKTFIVFCYFYVCKINDFNFIVQVKSSFINVNVIINNIEEATFYCYVNFKLKVQN